MRPPLWPRSWAQLAHALRRPCTRGGVDKVDQSLTDNPVARKRGKKYYQKIFFHLLDEALNNSFIYTIEIRSSFADPTPLAPADASRDVFPRGGTSHSVLYAVVKPMEREEDRTRVTSLLQRVRYALVSVA
ncbi:hypothetical protein TNCV_3102281 [Trichonephila clavipes]|nr:hypothetical protein TNCV_3102281 [Trichonephila clavipes]